jgi:putative hydrolase of the HAD superfamily
LQYEGIGLSKDQLRNEIDSYIDIDNDMVQVIQNLKQNNFKIALLSNANHTIFDRKIFQMYPDFKGLFDEIVVSSKVQMVKPSPDIFLYTLDRLGAKPAEAIFIDDGAENVQAAHNLGINGHVFTDYKSFLNYLKILGLV